MSASGVGIEHYRKENKMKLLTRKVDFSMEDPSCFADVPAKAGIKKVLKEVQKSLVEFDLVIVLTGNYKDADGEEHITFEIRNKDESDRVTRLRNVGGIEDDFSVKEYVAKGI